MGAVKFLQYDALINLIITISCILVVVFLPSKYSSYLLVGFTSIIYITFSFLVFLSFRKNHLVFRTRKNLDNNRSGYFFQIVLMVTTQLERMLIGLLWPSFLAYISVVGAGINAWRRLTLDDAILFSRLKENASPVLAFKTLKRYESSSMLVAFAGTFISLVYIVVNRKYGVVIGVDNEVIIFLVYLSLIYLFFMPSSIVTINLIRSSRFIPRNVSFVYTYFTIAFLMLCILLMSSTVDVNKDFVWMVVLLTASINFVVLLDYFKSIDKLLGNLSVFYFLFFVLLFSVFYYVK